MNIIVTGATGRQSGKTYYCLERLRDDPDAIMIVPNRAQAEWTVRHASEVGISPEQAGKQVLTTAEIGRGRPRPSRVLVDMGAYEVLLRTIDLRDTTPDTLIEIVTDAHVRTLEEARDER